MKRVVVTVKLKDEPRVRDIEVRSDTEAVQLAKQIASALKWGTDRAGQPLTYRIEVHPPGSPGRMLEPHETLASAGAWDGSWLVLHQDVVETPVSPKAPPVEPPPPIASAPIAPTQQTQEPPLPVVPQSQPTPQPIIAPVTTIQSEAGGAAATVAAAEHQKQQAPSVEVPAHIETAPPETPTMSVLPVDAQLPPKHEHIDIDRVIAGEMVPEQKETTTFEVPSAPRAELPIKRETATPQNLDSHLDVQPPPASDAMPRAIIDNAESTIETLPHVSEEKIPQVEVPQKARPDWVEEAEDVEKDAIEEELNVVGSVVVEREVTADDDSWMKDFFGETPTAQTQVEVPTTAANPAADASTPLSNTPLFNEQANIKQHLTSDAVSSTFQEPKDDWTAIGSEDQTPLPEDPEMLPNYAAETSDTTQTVMQAETQPITEATTTTPLSQRPPRLASPTTGPVVGRRPLVDLVPPGFEQAQAEEKKPSRFVWKQLDDE